jgi:hypothetical protein
MVACTHCLRSSNLLARIGRVGFVKAVQVTKQHPLGQLTLRALGSDYFLGFFISPKPTKSYKKIK